VSTSDDKLKKAQAEPPLSDGNGLAAPSPVSPPIAPQKGIDQAASAQFDTSSMTADDLKREFDIFRDVLGNVNQTLRFQIQLSVTLLAACVTVLNIVPPQEHQALLNDLDRWVFMPALVSMGVGYHGLEHHWYSRKSYKLDSDINLLYQLVRYKHRMVRIALTLQGLGLMVMMAFVLLEYK
jgi:hypothetical protein